MPPASRPMIVTPLPPLLGAAAVEPTSAPFRYRRSVAPSKVPTRCVQLFSAGAGPLRVTSVPAVLRRNFARPPSRNSRYCVFSVPFTVFSRIPPFCPATLGRTQASTLKAPRRSSPLDAGMVRAPLENAAALSSLTAPGWPRVTPDSYVPESPLPLASAATLPTLSPRRQNPAGRSASSWPNVTPTPSVPSAQLSVLVPLQLPWLTALDSSVASGGSDSVSVAALASAGPVLVSTSVYVSGSPTVTGSGPALPLRTRSARGAATLLLKVSALFAGTGSTSAALALASARSVPAAVGRSVTRSVAPPW